VEYSLNEHVVDGRVIIISKLQFVIFLEFSAIFNFEGDVKLLITAICRKSISLKFSIPRI